MCNDQLAELAELVQVVVLRDPRNRQQHPLPSVHTAFTYHMFSYFTWLNCSLHVSLIDNWVHTLKSTILFPICFRVPWKKIYPPSLNTSSFQHTIFFIQNMLTEQRFSLGQCITLAIIILFLFDVTQMTYFEQVTKEDYFKLRQEASDFQEYSNTKLDDVISYLHVLAEKTHKLGMELVVYRVTLIFYLLV